jgi:hypothetical protein
MHEYVSDFIGSGYFICINYFQKQFLWVVIFILTLEYILVTLVSVIDKKLVFWAVLVSRGFAHARGIGPHAKHPQRIISYVNLWYSVKNACGMRSAVRSVTLLRSIRMRERAYNFRAHFRVGRGIPYCTNYCQYYHATRRKLKLETAYHPQREIPRMRANSAWANPHDTKNTLRARAKKIWLFFFVWIILFSCFYYGNIRNLYRKSNGNKLVFDNIKSTPGEIA